MNKDEWSQPRAADGTRSTAKLLSYDEQARIDKILGITPEQQAASLESR